MSWWMIGLAVPLFAGYAKLSSAVLNRIMACHLPKRTLLGCELVHFASLPVYAGLLIAALMYDGLWLQDRSIDSLQSLGMVLISLGAIGLAFLVRSTIRHQTYRPPICEVSNESHIVDFRISERERTWHQKYVGIRGRGLALLPGNEQFCLEVSTKTYSLPRLPQEWDGLSIVHIADTHFTGTVTRDYFEMVCERAMELKPDLLVFTGDLLDDIELVNWLPATFGRLRAPLGQYFILGNHDWYAGATTIRHHLVTSGWTDLSSRSIKVASPRSGPPLILAGDETPWMGTHPDLGRVSGDNFRILLSHSPDNILWARENQFDLMLAGHTHGGQIRLPWLGPVYAPSRFGCRFASGVFWLNPTLLYVSRAISSREPIRYNCLPELTKLVLRST